MATLASRPAEKIPAGVPPLRAGQGRSFLWRRLHSLSGIVPVGAFLVEHFVSNAFATRGPAAYNKQVEFLTGVPFVLTVEIVFIYIPILFHALYGFWIWYRGDANTVDYPYIGNQFYTLQRWTGALTFIYIVYHTVTMRFLGEHLMREPQLAFLKVHNAFQTPWIVVVYAIGIIVASYHFAVGIWLFLAKWGFTPGPQARRKAAWVCAIIGVSFVAIGIATLFAFFAAPGPVGAHGAQAVQMMLNR